MPTVTVRGSALRQVQPDSVVVVLGLTHVAPDAPAALDAVAMRSQQLAGLLERLGVARDQWVTEGVTVAEEFEWRNDSQVSVGYRATSGVAATLRDLDQVGDLLRDAVGQCAANVRNLVWQVDPDNPHREALLGEAAGDARRRGEAYAAALGLRLGAVEVISDLPIDASGVFSAAVGTEMMGYSPMRSKMADGGSVSVSGGLIELAAEVYVRFGAHER